MKLTFKDVGQGDSIILKWDVGAIKKVGIIDCHRYLGANPILDELKLISNTIEIEFFVISHGHRDHYSGVLEVLEFCNAHNIKINNFVSTLHPTQFEFLKISTSFGEQKALVKLVEAIDKYETAGLIKDMYPAYNKIISYKLSDDFILECLYPRQSDYNKLGKTLQRYLAGKIKTKPDLNYISTIFKLYNDNLLSLLTSDCTIESLNYVQRKDHVIKSTKLHLIQVPHHGSRNNHNKSFWDYRLKSNNCPAVFSVGETSHNLPDWEVVEDFDNMGYEVHSTNYVSGIKSFIENDDVEEDYSFVLDSFSELLSHSSLKGNDRFRGDKEFLFNATGVSAIPCQD